MIEYQGYTGVFEFDAGLELFTGFVVDIRDQIYFEGESVEGLKTSMRRAVDHYLEVCEARGEEPEKPFSGKLIVRLGPDLHRAVAVAAAAKGQSINSWLVDVVRAAAAMNPKVASLSKRDLRGAPVSRPGTPPSQSRSRKVVVGAPKE